MIKFDEDNDYLNLLEIKGSIQDVSKILSYLDNSNNVIKNGFALKLKKEFKRELESLSEIVDWNDIGSDMLLSPYSYQKETIYYAVNNLNSLLILPTGSGKTPIMIGIYLELLKKGITDKPAIIVVKASLKYQWLKEVSKFSNLKASVIETPSKKKKKFDSQFENVDIFILNYETLENEEVYKKLKESGAETILCDEIQYISNHTTNRSKATYRFNDLKVRIGATATPITNNPKNLFGLFNLIDPELFESFSKFSRRFIIWKSFGQVGGIRNKKDLMDMISPYLFIKDEKEISDQLPSLVVNKIYCEMNSKLKKINERIMTDLENERIKSDEIESSLTETELASNEEYETSKAKIMAYQTFAQELVDDPKLLINSESKMAQQYSTKEESPKMPVLLNLVEEIIEGGDKVCIFTNYERMQQILKTTIERKLKVKCALVNGSMDAKERYRQAYDLFKDTSDYKVLIATSAMEEGISLSECRYLIEYDLAVSYASQTQRHGRVKRANSVHKTSYIYQIVCKGSWDEIQEKIIQKKQKYDKELIRSLS